MQINCRPSLSIRARLAHLIECKSLNIRVLYRNALESTVVIDCGDPQ